MRFKESNWNKFFDGSNKQTTFRTRKSKIGHHKAYAGSYYHPKLLGEFDVVKIDEKIFDKLTEQDAKDDGFRNLEDLKNELIQLNGYKILEIPLYKHWITNTKQWKQKT